jgi:NAD+--asparagine ADP-ribosyltransferase
MFARQAAIRDMRKVDANLGRFQTDICKDFSGQVFWLKWRKHHQGVQEVIVIAL